MTDTIKLLYRTEDRELVLLDFSEEVIDKSNIHNICKETHHKIRNLVSTSKNEITLEISPDTTQNVIIAYNDNTEISLNDLHSLQTMIGNVGDNVRLQYYFTLNDMEITERIIETMGNSRECKERIEKLDGVPIIDVMRADTLKGIELGKYSLFYTVHSYEVSDCYTGLLSDDLKDNISKELEKQNGLLTLELFKK